MKYRQLVLILILLVLINACASTGDVYFRPLTKDRPHAILKFESENVGYVISIATPVVKPTSINGLLIDQKREYWKMHAFGEFLIPPGDTVVAVSYSSSDDSAEGIVRFSAKRNEIYEVKHTRRKGRVFFVVTNSNNHNITYTVQFEKKIPPYMCPDKKLASALFEASAEGDIKRVVVLLNDGAEPDCSGPRGFTSLMIAASRGHADVVKVLIDAGANVNATTGGGWTSLVFAADRGYESIVSILLGAGADINLSGPGDYTALMAASEHGHTSVVKLLLKNNAYTKSRHLNGKAALDFAREAGNKDIVNMLEKADLQR